MKNTFFILCCALVIAPLSAQNTTTWFPGGVKWQHHYETYGGSGLTVLEQIGVEVIQGHACVKLHEYGYHYGWANGGPTSGGYRYLYAQHDSVFSWTGADFQLLYDFTRQAGDTIVPPHGYFEVGIVDSVGTTLLRNIPLRFQDITLSNKDLPSALHTRVYERLGGDHLIEWDLASSFIDLQYTLTCYRDDEYPKPDCYFYDPTYHPFPQGTASWSEENNFWCTFNGYQYRMEGDTAIAGLGLCKKLYARNTYVGNIGCPTPANTNLHEPYQLMGVLSQHTPAKKVYFTRLNENPILPVCVTASGTDPFPLGQTVLLYDFDLLAGDTVAWRSEPNVVRSIDSVLLKDGSWRRTFHFDKQGFYYWIEGIGSNLGLFNAYANLQVTDMSCALHCFRENEQLKYPETLPNDALCDSLVVATLEPNDLAARLKIYPNPAKDAVTVELPDDALPALARCFDAQGRELDRRAITATLTRWPLAASGASKIRFLQVQTADGRFASRMLQVD